MLIGYARVSTAEQNLDLQTDALTAAKCEKIFTDKASGARSDRKGLQDAIEFARGGDALVVWKLDRLGRSLQHLIEVINQLHARGIGLVSLKESIDTTTAAGKLVFHIFASLAEFERDIIRERTKAGLAAARLRGRTGGRPSVMDADKKKMAHRLLSDEENNVPAVAKALGISERTLRRAIAAGLC